MDTRKIITYEEFKEALKIVQTYRMQLDLNILEAEKDLKNVSKFAGVHKDTKLWDLKLKTRSFNALRQIFGKDVRHAKISDLENISISEIADCRNIGIGTVKEFEELYFYAGF